LLKTSWLSPARLAKGFTGADLKLASKEALRISFFVFFLHNIDYFQLLRYMMVVRITAFGGIVLLFIFYFKNAKEKLLI
jgi:hypothetical protein